MVDNYPLNEVRLFLLEADKKVRVRNCVQGTENDYNLADCEVGIKVQNGTLSIGPGVTLGNPVSLSPGIKLYKPQTQAYFAHLIDTDADENNLSDEAFDVEFIGVGDYRDECELVSIGKPRVMNRYRLSEAPIRVKITGANVLELQYEGDASSGIDYLIATNPEYIN